MTEQRLQRLRRAWDEGDLETQARLLRERMRSGELSEERVALAAYLGHEASSSLVDSALRPWGDSQALLRGVVAALRTVGHATTETWWGRLAQRLAWVVATLGSVRLEHTGLRPALAAVEAAERWLVCPCAACAQLASVTGHAALAAAVELDQRLRDGTAGETLGELNRGSQEVWLLETSGDAALIPSGGQAPACVDLLARGYPGVFGEGVPRVADEVVAWSLGLRDMVAERVAAREATAE